MSSNKLAKITELLCEDYKDVKLSPDYLASNGGKLKSRLDTTLKGVAESFDLFISVLIPTVSFNYKDEDFETDAAVIETQILAMGCDFDTETELFSFGEHSYYSVSPSQASTNLSLYYKDVLLEDDEWEKRCDLWWITGLPPLIDKTADDKISKYVCDQLVANSNEDEVIAAIKQLVKYHSPN